MRFSEFKLTERRMADLYHNSRDGDKILSSGVIKTSMSDQYFNDQPTQRELEIGPRISLTRDFHYDWAPHKFVIDQTKLASRQKIIPIDTLNPMLDEPRAESEEYVLKPIPLDMIKAVILPNIINDEYENNFTVAKMALEKGIKVFVGKHPKKLTPVTKDDISDASPEDAVAVVTDPGFTTLEMGQHLTQTELDSAYDEYGDEFTVDMLESYQTENFKDGKKPGRKGLAKRSGVDCGKSETELRKIAKNSSGEKQRMAHWCANMKGGRKK